jgi:hypothetical protein
VATIPPVGRWAGSIGIVVCVLANTLPIVAYLILVTEALPAVWAAAAFWAGIALGLTGIVMGWSLRRSRLGYAMIVLGALGLAIGGFVFLFVVGLCGPSWVVGGSCWA